MTREKAGEGNPTMNSRIAHCQLISAFGIIIVKFAMTAEDYQKTEYIEYRGRIFQKRYPDGGEPHPFYQIEARTLHPEDCHES